MKRPGRNTENTVHLLYVAFMVFYSLLLVTSLTKYSIFPDEAMHALGGVALKDLADLVWRKPAMILQFKSVAWNYYQDHENFVYPLVFYGGFFYLLEMVLYGIVGVSVLSARTLVVLTSIANLLIQYELARRIDGRATALLSVAQIAFSSYYFLCSKHCLLDVPLMLLTNLAFLSVYQLHDFSSMRPWIVSGILLGLTLATKVSSVLYVPLIYFAYSMWVFGKEVLREKGFLLSVGLMVGIFCLWLIPASVLGGSFSVQGRYFSRHYDFSFQTMSVRFVRAAALFYFALLSQTGELVSLLWLLGMVYSLYRMVWRKDASFALPTFWWVSSLLSLIVLHAVFDFEGDPVRHILASVPALSLSAGAMIMGGVNIAAVGLGGGDRNLKGSHSNSCWLVV